MSSSKYFLTSLFENHVGKKMRCYLNFSSCGWSPINISSSGIDFEVIKSSSELWFPLDELLGMFSESSDVIQFNGYIWTQIPDSFDIFQVEVEFKQI